MSLKEVYVCDECRTRHISFEDFLAHCRMFHEDEKYVPYHLDMREDPDE